MGSSKLTPHTADLLSQIAHRYLEALGALPTQAARDDIIIDLINAYTSDIKLDLRRLLRAPDRDLVHDLRVIRSGQLDIITGELCDGAILYCRKLRRKRRKDPSC